MTRSDAKATTPSSNMVNCFGTMLLFALACCAGAAWAYVPPVSSLGMAWESMPLRAMPMVSNFYGAANLRRDVEPGCVRLVSLSVPSRPSALRVCAAAVYLPCFPVFL
jgi:hypothetical protein